MIAKQAQNFYKEMLIDSLKVGELVADKISDEVYYYLSTIAEGIIPSTNFEQMWKFETGESSFILGAIDGLDSNVEVLIRENSAAWTKAAVDAGVSKAIEFVLGKYFEDFDLAKAIDALPQSIVKAISIMENFFPPILQDKVVSNFAPSFSPKYEGMDYAKDDCGIGVSVTNPFSYVNITNLSGFDHTRNCTAAGQNELAKGLIQYSINLFDQGTYNVPVNSSFGGAVQIFSGTDVSRRGIPLHINTPVDEEYSDYKSSLVNIGFINSNRQIVDDALKYTCMGLKRIPAYGEILEKACQVARYATNTGFMLAISVENIKLNHNHHALKSSENLSLSASTIRGNNNHTGMDSMLYESPYISLQSLVDSTSDSVRVIPLMFYKTTDDGIYASEISNYNQFKGVFIKRLGLLDTNQLKPLEIYPYEANINSYSNNELKTINDYHSLTVKTVNYEKIGETGIVRRVSRKNIPAVSVSDEIQEYRFQIDDLRPDKMKSIKIDFNTNVQFTFSHDDTYKWIIYMSLGGGKQHYVGEFRFPLVDENGLLVFRPKMLMNLVNEKLSDEEKFSFNQIQQEGPNMVTISLTNFLGLTGYSQFSFYYQSTLPYLRERFPKNLQVVSNLNEVFLTASNLGDPYEFTEGTLSLLKPVADGYEIVRSDLNSTIQILTDTTTLDSNGKTIWDQVWKISNSLGDDFLQKNHIEDGEYILCWRLKTEMRESNQSKEYNMKVRFYVDTKAPQLALNIPKTELSNSDRDGVWGFVNNIIDTSALRSIRGFVIPEGTMDTVFLFHNYGISTTKYDFSWREKINSLPQGMATVYVQAIDYATPNYDMISVLDQFVSGDSVTLINGWNSILNSDGSFISHLNGTTISKKIYINKEKPILDTSSVAVRAVLDTNYRLSANLPTWSRPQTENPVFNESELITLSFKLKNQFNRKTTDNVRIQLIFADIKRSLSKSFIRDNDFVQEPIFSFTEPEAQKLPDGVYIVSVIMKNAAGNITEVIDLPKKIVVDRTAPSVNQVMVSDPVYATGEDVDSANVYVSQPSDIEENRTLVTCFQQLSDGKNKSNWVNIASINVANLGMVRIPYSIKNVGMPIVNNQYSTSVGCFDAAGNFSMNSDVINVGHRYPSIVYPTPNTAPIATDIIQIKGIVPDPIVPKGNIQTAEYKVEWKNTDISSQWSNEGITYTNKLVSSKVNTLAIWNRDFLPSGNYELRVSVRGCKDSLDNKCDWVSSIVPVTLDDYNVNSVSKKPVISLNVPVQQIPGDSTHRISAYLNGANGSRDWSIQMKIFISDPFDSTKQVEATSAYADTMKVSPFEGTPKDFNDEGLYVWVDNGEWNVRYVGDIVVNSIFSHAALLLKYDHNEFEWINTDSITSGEYYNRNDTTMYSPEINFGFFTAPSYNYTNGWILKEKENNLQLKFKTAKPFILDLTSADTTVLNHIYCGANKYNYNALDSNLTYSQTVYVNQNDYRLDLVWNGLTRNNIYPSSTKAKVVAIATENIENGRVVYAEREWNMTFGITKVISNYGVFPDTLGEFVISRDTSTSAVMKLGDIGYEFGITGRNAKVTVVVKDRDGNVVKTFMKDKNCIAGEQKDAYSVSWNGITDGGFAATKSGRYTFEVSAVDDDGNMSVKTYPFVLTYGNLIPVPENTNGSEGIWPVLSMDEAMLDSNGDLRFIGKPDYILKANVEAKKLPAEERDLEYYWDYSGTQEPSIYRANRFSLGIRRKRESFPVTIVTVISTKGYHMSFDWYEYTKDADRYYFTVQVQKGLFEKNSEGGSIIIDKVALQDVPKNHLVGFDNHNDSEYPIGLYVKVFSAMDYEDIKNNMGGYKYSVNLTDSLKYIWNALFGNEKISNWDQLKSTELKSFFKDNFDKPLLWSTKTTFKYKSDDKTNLVGEKDNTTETCEPSAENGYVCDEKTEATYNPHKGMLTMDVLHVDGERYFGNNDLDLNGKSSNDGSATSVYSKLKLTVKPSYWNPKFGYNNLANRHTRFDHTNKTLYKEGNYFSNCPSLENFHDGSVWKHSSDYGLTTAFESQRFGVNIPNDCFGKNPLVFSDELNEKTKNSTTGFSQYSVQFFNETDNDTKFKAIVGGFGIDGSNKVFSLYSTEKVEKTLGELEGFNILRDGFIVQIAPEMMAEKATEKSNVRLSYPYNDPKDWEGAGVVNLCKTMTIRDVDDQDIKCYKSYVGASRIHYGFDDWTDKDWLNVFTVNGIVKNQNTSTDIINLNDRWNPNAGMTSPIFALRADSTNYKNEIGWVIEKEKFEETRKHSSWDANINTNPTLKILDNASKWILSDDESYVYNPGDVVTEEIEYIRSRDSVPLTYNEVNINGKEVITVEHLHKQNPYDVILEHDWVQELKLSEPKIFSRKADSAGVYPEHLYFNASVHENNQDVQVNRNGSTPNDRIEEMVSLRGRVPGENLLWKLSYLYNGRVVPLTNGNQTSIPMSQPYPLLYETNVNRLQGNTSFFLTYGSDNSNGDIYFKQLDVHIGERVNPDSISLVQSMYGNVSVQFPAGAYDIPVDVTVRVASLSDFRYRIFEGIVPIGAVVEILPSHKFNENDKTKWPRVAVEISRESLVNQNPLEARIYKPDTASKKILPLEVQEIAFFKGNTFLETCGDSSGVYCRSIPNGWDKIRISGKTPTFSTFIVMDTTVASDVHVRDSVENIPDFTCLDSLPVDSTIWMGIVNGYLEYPYPCVGESNYLLQLKVGTDVVAEIQDVAKTNIVWSARRNDIQSVNEVMTSRLALYGVNGKNLQLLGPSVLADTALPKVVEIETSVSDEDNDKQILLNVMLEDSESGIAKASIVLYFGGVALESRTVFEKNNFTENFRISKKDAFECVGCKATFEITIEDYGHNHISKKVHSEPIYPYPTSLVLWYPLDEGTGVVANEITNSDMDLDIVMNNPWKNGNSLYMWKMDDRAYSNRIWTGVDTVPMSVEFNFRSGRYQNDLDYSLLSWKSARSWNLYVRNGHISFDYMGESITFDKHMVTEKVTAHYVFVAEGKKVSLYKNGILVDQKNLSVDFVWISKGSPVIGSFENRNAMPGNLKSLRFYRDALTADQIYSIYNGVITDETIRIEYAHAVDLSDRSGLIVDQSCDIAGMAFLRQKNVASDAYVSWKVNVNDNRYSLYLLSRGYTNMESSVDVLVDNHFVGSYVLSSSGVWETKKLETLDLILESGEHTITVKPKNMTNIAAFALAPSKAGITSEEMTWNDSTWIAPEAKIQVEMHYPLFNDKSWMKADFRLKNLTDNTLSGVRLRYYYFGEGLDVTAQSFNPQMTVGFGADGNIYYAEYMLSDPIAAKAYANWGYGPQIGIHRNDKYNSYPSWNYVDDPSFDSDAIGGSFKVTDRIALLDEDGNLLSNWSCYESGSSVEMLVPTVRALALEETYNASAQSTIAMFVENIGNVKLDGFEVRYYFRDTQEKPVFDIYSNMFAKSTEYVDEGNGLYYVSFRYEGIILNPGEKSDFGNGVKFALHHSNYQNWNAFDDPSHYGLTNQFTEADSIVVMDLSGNLLWGAIPKSGKMAPENKEGDNSSKGKIVVVNDQIIVTIDEASYYTLQVVDAQGSPIQTLFGGTWSTGDHVVSIKNMTLSANNYVLLKRNGNIVQKLKLE